MSTPNTDGILDQLPQPTLLGRTPVGGINLDKARTRHVLTALAALSAAPDGFAVADLATKVHAVTGHTSYTTRQASYDIRKLRGHNLIIKDPRRHRYHVPPTATRTIVAILTLREHVISPIVAGVRVPRRGRPPATWTTIDRDYETLRRDMTTLFDHLALNTQAA